jgi:hypothetical protein
VEINELIVRDDELNVGDDKVVLSNVAEVGDVQENSGDADLVSQPRFTGHGEKGGPRKCLILNYNYYIRILLINTNFLVYICYILCCG